MSIFDQIEKLSVKVDKRTRFTTSEQICDLCITPVTDFLSTQKVAKDLKKGARSSSVSPLSQHQRTESPCSLFIQSDEDDIPSRVASPSRMTDQPLGISAPALNRVSRRLNFKDLLQDLMVQGECAMAYHPLAHDKPYGIGVVLQNIKLRSNTLYQLHLSFEIERDENSVAPQLFVSASNSMHRWKKDFALPLAESQSSWTARFYVPSRIYALNIELMFDSHSLFTENQCRVIVRSSECYLLPVPDMSNLERMWTSPATNKIEPTRPNVIRNNKLPGMSNIHDLFDGVYVLRDANGDWASSSRFQKHLALHSVQFHFIDIQVGGGFTSSNNNTCCTSVSCQRCFYFQPNGSWIKLNSPTSTSQPQQQADITIQLQRCLRHAIDAKYTNILLISDTAGIRNDWAEDIMSHRSNLPSSWRVMSLSSAQPLAVDSVASTIQVPYLCADRFLPDDSRCAAIGINGGLDAFQYLFTSIDKKQISNLDQWFRESLLIDEKNQGKILHWLPALFAHASIEKNNRYWFPMKEVPTGSSIAHLTGSTFMSILLPIEYDQIKSLETSGQKQRCLKRCLDAYRNQTMRDWSLTIFIAKDTLSSVFTSAMIREWTSGDSRVQVQWIMREQDMIASAESHLARWCNIAGNASKAWLVGRLPYLPIAQQLANLLDLTRAYPDTCLFHSGPSGAMTCAPAQLLDHSFCGSAETLSVALNTASSWQNLRETIIKSQVPIRNIDDSLSCWDICSFQRQIV